MCGKEIKVVGTNPQTRLFDLGCQQMYCRVLEIGDASTVTSVFIGAENGSASVAQGSTTYTLEPRIRESWEPVTALRFLTMVSSAAVLRYRYIVSVTGNWGFPSVPGFVRQALRLVGGRVTAYPRAVASPADNVVAKASSRQAIGLSSERVGVVEAVREHWILLTLPVLLLVGAAIAVSYVRPPEYTAQVRLRAGSIDVGVEAIPAVVVANQSLAAEYSRVVDAQEVVRPVGRELGVGSDKVASHVSASPVPDSSIFLIEATGSSPVNAIRLAKLTSDALIVYATTLKKSEPTSEQVFSQFEEASLALRNALSVRDQVRVTYLTERTERARAALSNAQAQVDVAQLRVQTLRGLYQTRKEQETSGAPIQVVNSPTTAHSDRLSVLKRLTIICLMAGAIIGIALAVLRGRRLSRKRTRVFEEIYPNIAALRSRESQTTVDEM